MVLTRAQAKIKLAQVGLLETIENSLSALPLTDFMRIKWYDAQTFERLDPDLIAFCVQVLGLDDAGIDSLFE